MKSSEGERGPQWQGRELGVLLEGMEGRYSSLHGKFSNSISRTVKDKLWQEIVERVSYLVYLYNFKMLHIFIAIK